MSTALEHPTVETHSEPQARPYLFTVDDFYRMIDLELFPDDARVGLWEGQVYEKMAKTQAHAVSGSKVQIVLNRALPSGWHIGGENPIKVSDDKAPLPDLVVLRGIPDDYLDRRPEGVDVGLVVEISLASLKVDTGAKLAGYASAGVPTYWVVNLVDRVVLVYSAPVPAEGHYASMATVKPGESFPFTLDGIAICPIAASDLLPIR